MKVLAAALAVLLLVAICSLAEADRRVSRSPALSKDEDKTMCCFSYISYPLPHSIIRSAYKTSNTCSMPAVVLITRKGKEICADPKALWVQKYL
ncbi:C-C motif chemokine 5 [Lonchura striata]|uniref:C-C motif chemokine 5 n=1 Tax=Lonchura striata TaxID=40157 RepID=A0A218V2P1_9PASE|nr:C-C motif chemokine 5 [Lonchura striata domestica]OWK59990.1 C-C motif chemokine 5 [Lonchura striata domestica]